MHPLFVGALLIAQSPGGPKQIFEELDTMTSSTATVTETATTTPEIGEAPPPAADKRAPVEGERRGILGVNVVNLGGRVRVKSLKKNGPAQRAGIRRWDTLIAIGGQPVLDRGGYVRLMRGRKAGESVDVEWETSAGERFARKIKLGAGRRTGR